MMTDIDAIRSNNLLCRNKLDTLESGRRGRIGAFEPLDDIAWFQVKGLTRFWQDNKAVDFNAIFSDILSSICVANAPFAFLLIGDRKGLHFYVGSDADELRGISETYRSCMPGIDIKMDIDYGSLSLPYQYGGLVAGYPIDKAKQEKGKVVLQMDNICRGMQGNHFAYLIVAVPTQPLFANAAINGINRELRQCSLELTQNVSVISEMGTDTKQATNYDIQRYSQNLEKLEHMLEESLADGLWSVCGYYMADSLQASQKLKGILKAAYAGSDDETYESFRCVELCHPLDFLRQGAGLVMDPDPEAVDHPVGMVEVNGSRLPFYQYILQTLMNSRKLSVMCRFPKTEFAGYYIDEYVEFDTSMRKENQVGLRIGEVTVPGRNAETVLENEYAIELKDMTRHALIIGITGGGKTNTAKALLSQLWLVHNVPFLVIESAKREYWELMNLEPAKIRNTSGKSFNRSYENLTVYTLGSEEPGRSVKFRMNPFQLVGNGVSLQTHIDYLLSTFKASFELYAPMPYILETAVYEVYSDRGWDIIENRNIYGLHDYPTLTDLYYKIDVVTNRLGYNAEVQSNVKAALKARINSLRIGGKGAMMDTQTSVPISQLLNYPTVLELEDLGDDDTKSFVIGILMVQLYEYRKSETIGGQHDLKHVLMIEEAHRLLKNVPPSADGGAKGKSVEFFCNMLAEIRSFGQGILVADQIPTKLAPDTIKNTNLKIVHRTVMREDREAIGYSMNMTPEQISYLSSLPRGRAAVYSEGDNVPKLLKIDFVQDVGNRLSRDQVLEIIRKRLEATFSGYDKVYTRHKGCMMCEKRCECYETIISLVRESKQKVMIERIKELGLTLPVMNNYVICLEKVAGRQLEVFERICAVGELLKRLGIKEEKQAEYVVAFSIATYRKYLLDR